ncbi:hypothetical protein GCK72_016513 [Caenorhabditis remanei]|uniref:Protein kinase domain-containing protein n=1 Tax=Caenorhabditis remanei TaxID=31234 RepID=A0A6A5G4M6_CAERE|nr:hypothetical protein GCK72_016513 [Caenorhabditis remanei]KAF1749968.1 hypothetical protein GCK72_016513 [Caenorhabditis remanei]
MRARSSSVTVLYDKRHRNGVSLDRNNNYAAREVEKQPRMVHTSSRHVNEGFFGVSKWIQRVDGRQDIEKHYEIGVVIGKGNFSSVHLTKRKEDGTKCALKQVEKRAMRGKCFFVDNEVEMLSLIQHDHIISIIDAFSTENQYFIVFEHAQYGDLYETIRKNGRIEEPDAAIITLQVASALTYLHERNVVHRDVKPENLLLVDKFSVKLCDFGLACHVLGPLYRICGTPTYCAPEVLRETGYSTLCDIWSLGVVLYVMLVGYAPFRAPDQTRLFKLIMQAKPNMDMPEWKGISMKAKDLVSRLMNKSEDRRPLASQIVSHPWIAPFTMDNIDDE